MRAPRAIAAAALVAAGLACAGVAPPASANPVVTGCPTGHPLTSVADLTASGHKAPARIDAAANGGNGDGLVCARLLPDAVCVAQSDPCLVDELYLFSDNVLPQGRK